MNKIKEQCRLAAQGLIREAGLTKGDIVIIGCSTSEVMGSRIGTDSNPDTAKVLFEGLWEVFKENGIYMAAQCCEHLNRAVIAEREAVPFCEPVNAVPQPKAGGSFATEAYKHFKDPVTLEEIKADAGIDIGSTLIGMHLKKVAVPVRLDIDHIGSAYITAARTRAKFIGGERAHYNEKLM